MESDAVEYAKNPYQITLKYRFLETCYFGAIGFGCGGNSSSTDPIYFYIDNPISVHVRRFFNEYRIRLRIIY